MLDLKFGVYNYSEWGIRWIILLIRCQYLMALGIGLELGLGLVYKYSIAVYRNTTPATQTPKIQPAGRCGNINSVDQLHHTRSVAYSAEQVLLNKQQIWCGGADLHC